MMTNHFKNMSVLVVNEVDSSRKMLVSVLRLLGFKNIDQAYEKTDAFSKFKDKQHSLIISALVNGMEDAIGLAKLVRLDPASPNAITPIMAITGPKTMHLIDVAREVGITDLLQLPYTVDDISAHVKFVCAMSDDMLIESAKPQAKPEIAELPVEEHQEWPKEEETHSLTEMLLDHYMKHHEIVLTKLKFAQDATKRSIDELRSTHEKMRHFDNSNITQFNDFEKMWEEIIKMFVDGGIEEEELFKIEKIITTVPADIKEHYNALSNQDKSFLSLVESLNADAYKKAKERVTKLQAQPNPFNGKTIADYHPPKPPEKEDPDAFIFMPKRKK